MTDLPVGWAQAPVAELAGSSGVVTDGDWVESKDQDPSGGVRLIQLADIGDGEFLDRSARFMNEKTADRLNCTYLEPGDLLIARMPDPLGRACVFPGVGKPAVTAVDVFIWRPDANGADVRWLMYSINSPEVRSAILNQAGGTTRQRISGGRLKEQVLPVPPLAEQRRIAAKLDLLRGRINCVRKELERVPSLISRYKQAILTAAFDGTLTAKWREATGNDQVWDSKVLSDLATVGTGATPKRGTARYYENGTIPWVTSGAVNDDAITSAEGRITPAALKETNCRLYPPGTLLVAMYGEGRTRGRVSVLKIEAATNQALAAIQIVENRINHAFLFWLLRANYLKLREKAAGGVQPNLNLSIIKDFVVPVPPESEQDEIASRIESAFAWLDRLAAEHARAAALLPKLEQALLAKAFRGELVPQDPGDEPASVLLERIRAAHVEAADLKRKSRSSKLPRAPRPKAAMTKSRLDQDVMHQPYLAKQLRDAGGSAKIEDLFHRADLPVTDFYKQLAWEVEAGHIKDQGSLLEAA